MGLLAIAARGGVTVVQDPDEALFDGMPRTALAQARVDHTLTVRQIPALVARLAREPVDQPVAEKGRRMVGETEDLAPALMQRDFTAQERDERAGETTVYTCAECGGTLWQISRNGLVQFRCHVGHTYEAETLLGEMSEELEAALRRCVRMLMEKATLTRQLARRLRAAGVEAQAERIEEQAQADYCHGQLIRDLLLEGTPNPGVHTPTVEQAVEDAPSGRRPPASAGEG